MKYYCAIAAMFLSTAAMAQEKPADAPATVVVPTPTPQPKPTVGPSQDTERLFYFEVTLAEVQAIGNALNELPKRVADPLILKLNGQLQAQAKIAADYAKATTPPVKDADDKPARRRVRR